MPHVLILGGSWFLGRALAEEAVSRQWAVTILRRGRAESGADPALGPGEYVGRTAWWLRRLRRAGEVVAPFPADRSIQPVDVRDVAAFALSAPAGIFNVTTPGNDTFSEFIEACQKYAPAPDGTAVQWVDPEILTAHGVRQWTELPLWRTYAGAWAVDSSRARAAGLVTGPIADTVRDTAQWLAAGGELVASERAAELGLDPAKEMAILADHQVRVSTS